MVKQDGTTPTTVPTRGFSRWVICAVCLSVLLFGFQEKLTLYSTASPGIPQGVKTVKLCLSGEKLESEAVAPLPSLCRVATLLAIRTVISLHPSIEESVPVSTQQCRFERFLRPPPSA